MKNLAGKRARYPGSGSGTLRKGDSFTVGYAMQWSPLGQDDGERLDPELRDADRWRKSGNCSESRERVE